MSRTEGKQGISWKEWSPDSFDLARKEGRLVLLDLTASWCHWCHVMDERTYADPEVANAVNRHFVPIRVDIDRRPDISERYNRGGFPTTAFLSDQGESIWGATFVPPADMKRIMEAILRAKESGEIDKALVRSRTQPTNILMRAPARIPVGPEQLSGLFEDIFSAYDVDYGGFGSEPKFPHPDVIDLLIGEYLESGDGELLDAALNTIEQMGAGLCDKVEGGVFRYSVTRDWRTPHYEKMLETNIGYLRNLIHAFGATEDPRFMSSAKQISNYLMTRLLDPRSGGFYGSQDADEEYYGLPTDARRMRRAPSIDRTVYAGWNAEASTVFMLAGNIFGDDELRRASRASWEYCIDHLWNPKIGLVRHVATEDVCLFEDQVSFFNALLAQLGESLDDSKTKVAHKLIDGVNNSFGCDDGRFCDIMNGGDAIGEMSAPRKPLAENSDWALALAQFGAISHEPPLVERAHKVLTAFTLEEIEAHGVFAASYLRARWALDRGIAVVEIHSGTGDHQGRGRLLAEAQREYSPSIIPVTFVDDGVSAPYAIVCTERGCTGRFFDPDELKAHLRSARSQTAEARTSL